jgi:hypothetical protein
MTSLPRDCFLFKKSLRPQKKNYCSLYSHDRTHVDSVGLSARERQIAQKILVKGKPMMKLRPL